MGQHENGGDLEHQGAQERNNGGYYAVVERGKECRAKDVKTAEQEAEGIQLHAEGSQFQQFHIITHKEAGKRGGQQLTEAEHRHTPHGNDPQADTQQVFSSSVLSAP